MSEKPKMPADVYSEYKKFIRDFKGTKEELQEVYNHIFKTYSDAPECLKDLDHYQGRWTMNTFQ